MKVAICTLYHNNYNYGGQLQGYALQQVLQSIGYESYLVPYEINYKKYLLRRIFRSRFNELQSVIHAKKQSIKFASQDKSSDLDRRRKGVFIQFENTVPHTSLITEKTLDTLLKQFDCFVTGSDQVWNPLGWDKFKLLEFVPSNKIKFSYAASFGRTLLNSADRRRLNKALSSYDGISVREQSGLEIIDQLSLNVSNKPAIHLDPTLLLDSKAWEEALDIPHDKFMKENYAFIYFARKNNNQFIKAIDWCKEHSLKPVIVTLASPMDSTLIEMIEPYIDLSVAGWVHAIRDAQVVITDSFHGTAFSINFKKTFCSIMQDGKSGDDRQENLLTMIDAPSCLIDSSESIKVFSMPNAIDEVLAEKRQEANEYLKRMLLENQKIYA